MAMRLSRSNGCGTKMMNAMIGHEASGTEFSTNQFPPGHGARAGLFIVAVQWSYYNALKAPNHLPHE
jgi:hypothetical protein